MNLTQEQLHQLLAYNKNTGELIWKPRDVSLFKDELLVRHGTPDIQVNVLVLKVYSTGNGMV